MSRLSGRSKILHMGITTLAVIIGLKQLHDLLDSPMSTTKENCEQDHFDSATDCESTTLESGLQYYSGYQVKSGVPQLEICKSFLTHKTKKLMNLDCDIQKNTDCEGICDPSKTKNWTKTDCGRFKLGSTYACFACRFRESDETHRTLQIFDVNCTKAMLFNGVNAKPPGILACKLAFDIEACKRVAGFGSKH